MNDGEITSVEYSKEVNGRVRTGIEISISGTPVAAEVEPTGA